ncbi:dienelactone hydrolase [Sphingomonas zeicaulis]|uniref:dienelactone hydrolase family protein n=1 Tax=Sphingomonas zeicaulis TaxID=1632740 RepID=UPI003D1E14C3
MPHAPANGGAVLVLHEADGLGQNVRRRCAMLASLGYVAAAADLHGGGQVLEGGAMMSAVARFRADADLMRSRVAAAFAALEIETGLSAPRIAVIGYCFGGYAALEFARSGAESAAIASFHGLLTTPRPAAPGAIRAPLLVATGMMDPLVPEQDVEGFEHEMRAADADWHVLRHGRAYHSFSNAAVGQLDDPRMRYDATADAVSWAAATALLAATIPGPAEK